MFCQRLASTSTPIMCRQVSIDFFRFFNASKPTAAFYSTTVGEAPFKVSSAPLPNLNVFDDGRMDAWVTKAFGVPLVQERVSIPKLWRDDQVLIKVEASSVNPIDTRMTEGYGNEILSRWRDLERCNWNPIEIITSAFKPTDKTTNARLPLIAGRDVCGEVTQTGNTVTNVRVGDKVIAVIPGHWPGAHAEYVVASANALTPKPVSITAVDACALAYTACTMWAALVTVARVNPRNASNVRVLIHGGAGGMGVTSIQFLRAWGSPKVVATCSAQNMNLLKELGALPIDYNSPTAKNEIIDAGPFEVILDCATSELADWSDNIMGIWRNCVHVSMVSPLLMDTDRYGLPMGLASTFLKFMTRSVQPALQGRWFTYAFFMPNAECLAQLATFLNDKKVVPVIEKVYQFDEIPAAYAKVGQLRGRGKSVIDFAKK